MIDSVDDIEFAQFCEGLAADRSDSNQTWPAKQLDRMAQAGVYRWFVAEEQGGLGWSSHEVARAYLKMSEACLASTFVLTQRIAALKRIAASPNALLLSEYLADLVAGKSTATVGISHLTTSRLHLKRPIMTATKVGNSHVFSGTCPWVTGASGADRLLVGAILEKTEGRGQVLGLVDCKNPGVTVEPGFELIALNETHTGRVHLNEVVVDESMLVAGPSENVLASLSAGPSTGSYQSSALALGLAKAAIAFIKTESVNRPDLTVGVESLFASHNAAVESLLQAAAGNPSCTSEQLRADANSLVLRSTQAAMVAAKGAGFMAKHPVGRWCREAMFFLVWSCPQSVQDANLCELAGVE